MLPPYCLFTPQFAIMQRLIGELKKESRKCKFLSVGLSAHRANCDNSNGFPPEEIYDISWSASRIKRQSKNVDLSITPCRYYLYSIHSLLTSLFYTSYDRCEIVMYNDSLDKRKKDVNRHGGVNGVGRRACDFVRVDCSRKRSERRLFARYDVE